ncbi:MAG TPA: metallophosphoesterase [Terriglobales bacterium]|nr:metallophosphoesterase [Terriglobales bacterium]
MAFGVVRLGIGIFLLAVLYFSQRFWFRSFFRLGDRLHSEKWRHAVHGLAIATLSFLIIGLVDRIFGLHWLGRGRVAGVFIAILQLWVLSSMLAYLFFRAVRAVEYVWRGIKRVAIRRNAEAPDPERRNFFRATARLAAAVPIVAGIYGYAAERFNFQIRKVDIPVANLPEALDGFKIVQLSDIHIGDFMPREEVARAIDMANELGAHVAMVTGDFITGHNDPLAGCIEEIARLRVPLGIWGCNGNHEIYAEAEDEAQLLFARHGMKLLRDERTELKWHGAKLNLIGVDYQRDHMVSGPKPPMLAGVESLIRRDMPNVLLSHNPNSFYKAAELGIELSLAGHSHGGQVNVEILDRRVNPSRFITEFIAGLYRLPIGSAASNAQGKSARQHASLYVNRGLGTIGLPARLGVDPEISLLTLRQA